MAGAAVIGALRVVLGADTAAFDKGLSDAEKRLGSFGAGIGKLAAGIGLAVAAAAAALGVSIKHAVDEADKLGKMAQKVGVPVDELSKLKHAADLSGVGIDALGTSLGKLSKAMVEAAAKPTSDAALAFRALGISVTNADGTLKSSSQVLTDVAGKFEGLKDGAGKTAVSMALFGKTGKDLIPLLNAGAGGLQEMKDEAEKLGIVIDTKTAKSAEEFNDNLTRLGKVKDGIILKITAGMLPAMENLSANMVRVAKEGDLWKSAGEGIGAMMVGLFNTTERLSLVWQRLGVEWQALREFMQTDVFSGKVLENWRKFTEAGEESKRMVESLRVTQETAAITFGNFGSKADEVAKKQRDFNFAALGGKTALDGFIESTNKALAAQTAELQTVGMAAGAKERLRVVLQGLQVAQTAQIPITEALRLKLGELGIAAEQVALKTAGANLVLAAAEPHEKYRLELENNRLALEAFGATAEQIAAVQKKTAENYGATWEQVAGNAAGSFAAMATAFGKENRSMAIAGKALAIVQAVINAYVASSKALASLPPPMSYVAAAAALAQGLATVANIRSQQIPAMATGGAMRLNGAFSGHDSQLLQARVNPGEQVDIWRPGEGGDPRRGGGTIVHVHPKSRFDREYLAEWIDEINGMVADGYRLKIA